MVGIQPTLHECSSRAHHRTAVALRYHSKEDNAPRVVASGQGEIARRILELAQQHGIPIHEAPAVVEALAQLEVGTEIPAEFYQMVAEILAFIYSIDKKSGTR